MSISIDALKILENAKIDENLCSVTLHSGELDRGLYEEVNTVLTRLRGKWNKKSGSHIFPHNPKPTVSAVLKTQEMPPKNPTAFFPTPRCLVEDMVELADFHDLSDNEWVEDFRILEPSAGVGGIADYIREIAPNATLDLVEFLPLNQNLLKAKGYNPWCGDFMEFNTDYSIKYNYIFMNPPFSLDHDKKAYITHIEHAFRMLKSCGTLMAIAPTGFITNSTKKDKNFLDFIGEHGRFCHDPEESFEESGTKVATVTIELSTTNWKVKPYNGYANQHVWSFMLHLNNEFDLYKQSLNLFEQKAYPTDEQILDYIEDLQKYLVKTHQEVLPVKYNHLYLNRFKRECDEHREYNGLTISSANKEVIEPQTVVETVQPKTNIEIEDVDKIEIAPDVINEVVTYTQLSLFD